MSNRKWYKRDFYDLYAVLKIKIPLDEACMVFKRRFEKSNINTYHVLRSLVFFYDAEEDPNPIFLVKGKKWEWESVKSFFERNIRKFEKCLII